MAAEITDTSDTLELQGIQNIPSTLTSYDYAVLTHCWALGVNHRNLLNQQITFFTSVKTFLSLVKEEHYPKTYEDTLKFGGVIYFISYIDCSASYLEHLEDEDPESVVIFQLRVSNVSRLYRCLVRLKAKSWTRESMVQHKMIEYKNS